MNELWTLPATELIARIARGDVTSVETVTAHIARIEAVNAALGAVVVTRYDEALAEARAVDERRGRGEDLGPLGGLPVTIKECLDVAGTAATFGLPSRVADRAAHDGPHVARWRRAGAVVVAKTNVPQLMIFAETDNPLYGRTNNPWHLGRSCGGSSGGEGAIIAAGGSPLGLGSDIGGSLRSPAAACGIASLKPTSGRMDDSTRLPIYAGQRAIVSQEGPLGRTVADVALGFAIAAGGENAEATPVAGLRIGYYEQAGSFPASPALARAVREAANVLRDCGADVVPFEPPRVDDAMDLFFGILSADGGRGALEALGEDKRDPRVAELIAIGTKPRMVIAAIAGLLALTGQRSLHRIVRNYGFTATHHYWKLVEGLRAYQTIFAHAMDDADGGPLDLIISPPAGLPALEHGASAQVITAGAYAPLYNLLGYPCGTLPVTRVRDDEQAGRARSADRMFAAARRTDSGSAGLPVGVQFAGRPWREDVVLAAMAAVESTIREHPEYPATPIAPNAGTG